jgi:hypothetical protein
LSKVLSDTVNLNPVKPRDVWTIGARLQLEHRRRDLALFNLAIDSTLRGCDLVRVQISDVCVNGQVREEDWSPGSVRNHLADPDIDP